MLDSSDEELAGDDSGQKHPDFQDQEDEYDSSEPYEPVVQTLDLLLGVEVLHMAFPQLPTDLYKSGSASLPAILSQNVVIAMTCSDFLVRVISVPLTPPSPQMISKIRRKGRITNIVGAKSLFGEQLAVLSSGKTHQSIPHGISVSFTARREDDLEDTTMKDDNSNVDAQVSSRDTSRSHRRSQLANDQIWDLLIASHSADLSGLLLVHRIPLVAEGTSMSIEQHIPWRIQYLASPAVSVEFSSGLYPAPRHSQLLVAEEKGVVRILDCLPSSKAPQGRWLVSLYTEFETLQDSMTRRKPILAASWILGGTAIMVLLLDGKWGVWDHEGLGPKPSQGAQAHRVRGDRQFSAFAIHEWIGDTSKSKAPLPVANARNNRSILAPMTPSTRKVKQDQLFAGPTALPDGPARGGLFIMATDDASNGRPNDEATLLWYRSNVVIIPSLITHWQNKVRGSGNLFGSGAKGEPKTLNNIDLGGEFCNEMGLIASYHQTRPSKNNANLPEILVTGEKRMIVVAPPLTKPEAIPTDAPSPTMTTTDQKLLARKELDVDGMDRLLFRMSNGHMT